MTQLSSLRTEPGAESKRNLCESPRCEDPGCPGRDSKGWRPSQVYECDDGLKRCLNCRAKHVARHGQQRSDEQEMAKKKKAAAREKATSTKPKGIPDDTLRRVIAECSSMKEACARLGITSPSIYRRKKKLGIVFPWADGKTPAKPQQEKAPASDTSKRAPRGVSEKRFREVVMGCATAMEAADKLGVTDSAVRHRCRKLGMLRPWMKGSQVECDIEVHRIARTSCVFEGHELEVAHASDGERLIVSVDGEPMTERTSGFWITVAEMVRALQRAEAA